MNNTRYDFKIGKKELLSATIEEALESGASESDILSVIKKSDLDTIKLKHANALLLLTGNTTPEERDTWIPKYDFAKRYLGKAKFDAMAELMGSLFDEAADKSVVAEFFDHFSVTDEEIESAENSLVEGETLEQWCESVVAKYKAGFDLTMFAEGFKQQTNAAINSATALEQRDAIMSAATTGLSSAIAEYKTSAGLA